MVCEALGMVPTNPTGDGDASEEVEGGEIVTLLEENSDEEVLNVAWEMDACGVV